MAKHVCIQIETKDLEKERVLSRYRQKNFYRRKCVHLLHTSRPHLVVFNGLKVFNLVQAGRSGWINDFART